MANRRMFSKDIIDSDRFLDMPPTSQNLYFHLGLQADDDGFVSSPKKVKRMCGANDDDLKLLEAKRFIISFESGVIVITDWKLNNQIKKDRYNSTIHLEEKSHLLITENNTYSYLETERNQSGTIMEPSWNQNGTQMEPQVSIAKVSIAKDSLVKGSIGEESKGKQSKEKSSLEEQENSADPFASPSFKQCIELYENHFGVTGKIEKNSLMDLYKVHGYEFLYEAINKASTRNEVKSPIALINFLLNEWSKKGFTTLDDIEEEQEKFNEQFEE